MAEEKQIDKIKRLMTQQEKIRNIGVCAHIDHGKTTFSDNLLSGAGMLSEELAGKACAFEGVMPQTETVLRQALRERVKPVLFINKVDRLIREVKLTPEAMMERFVKIINHVNSLIEQIAPDEFKQKWKVGVQNGSVAFGSAFQPWALRYPYMQRSKINFKEVIDALTSEE